MNDLRRRAPLVVHGNTTYDPNLFLLHVVGQTVKLTRNEVILIEALMPRFGRTVPKAVLLNDLYGHRASPPGPKAIDYITCRLRRKLRLAGANLRLRGTADGPVLERIDD